MALGVGLLIGAERERRNLSRAIRSNAGIRTFSAAALAGAVSYAVGGVAALSVTVACIGLLAAAAYWRLHEEDPGLTTEIALVLTPLLGALAMDEPAYAAGAGVIVAILLAARAPLHRFVGSTLSAEEVRDGLILALIGLVVLPLAPDRAIGPYGALNPHMIVLAVTVFLAIGGAGHILVRALGPTAGLPLAGLAGGFVSSLATIAAMGTRAKMSPARLGPAIAGAVLSTIATIVQLAILLAVVSPAALRALAGSLAAGIVTAAIYGAVFTLFALRDGAPDGKDEDRAFSLQNAVMLAVLIAAAMAASAALRAWLGPSGLAAAALATGLVDAHAGALPPAMLVAAGDLAPGGAVIPILLALSANGVSKVAMAISGGRRFATCVIPGIVLVSAAAWAGAWLQTSIP